MRIAAVNIGKKAIKITNSLINLAVFITILLLVAAACYAMWDSAKIYGAADAKQYEIYKPTEENTESFEDLQAINPEVFSWLTVYGTHIDYPVTQGEDNMKYVNTSVKGAYSLSGSIFLDSDNSQDFSDFNSILYGHHMEKQAMFGDLDQFVKKDFFEAHKYGNLFYGGKNHGLEFFAFLHTDAYDADVFTANIQGKTQQQACLDGLLEKATHTREIGVSTEDRILLLTTCASSTTNGRDILVARITNTVYEDTFITEETIDDITTVDAQRGFFAKIPPWLFIAIPVILPILLAVIVIYIKRKQKRKGQ